MVIRSLGALRQDYQALGREAEFDYLKVGPDEDGVEGDDCAACLRHLVATKSQTVARRKSRGLLNVRA